MAARHHQNWRPGSAALRAALVAIVGAWPLAAAGVRAATLDKASVPERVSFNEHIRPIFAKHCVACHGGVKQASGLSLIYRDQATAECESGLIPIVPGKADESYLIERVSDPDPDSRMPPAEHGPPLDAEQIALLRKWIDQGAEWELHWSLVAPKAPALPAVKQETWPRDPLDRFILARLEAEALQPALEADRAAWLRRASLDLIGLPPSPEEYDDFELDNRPDAYEQAVDRLLASPHFGERWTSMWLDLARYADTVGYEKDPGRTIWPYRDWLIRAFNVDMPYDQFTIKQLAGDLLPDATLEDRLATAFHRNTQTNTEGGTDDEEFRTVAVLDRVSTTWQVWQGATFRCTQCHSHPYDPFRHDEYYRFAAFFNTSRDADLNEDQPLLSVPDDPAKWDEANGLDRKIRELREGLFQLFTAVDGSEQTWRYVRPLAAAATGTTQLVIHDDDTSGTSVPEVLAEGTTPVGSTFTIELPLDESPQLTAVRIEALPKDLAAALKTPEAGFVVSQLKAELVSADGASAQELKFAAAACDEPSPLFDPADSLNDSIEGWGDYTRIAFPRHAVFVLSEPVKPQAGSRLRLALTFNHVDSGGGALFIQRARLALSSSGAWSTLVNGEPHRMLTEELARLVKRRADLPAATVPVMAEQHPPFARHTFTFVRGNWLDKEKEVPPGTPAVLPPLPADAQADRLAMARWLTSPANPLTARVMVNRLWQELFGRGIVETADDLGTSGVLPSHPELLDHLALRFQNDYAWSMKKLLRALVLSATYRQDAAATPEALAKDSQNRLLSRGPRTRLSAEMIRDQALVFSGRLCRKMYGKPVMPPQPEGVWRSVYNNESWVVAEGEDRYRRAVYTYWKRTSGYPSLITFDVPSRDVCVARRIATNTPLQALVTLNDQAFVELAQGFAERMEAAGGGPAQQISAAYQLALGRPIHAAKLQRLLKLYDQAAVAFDASAEQAKPLAPTRERYALVTLANAMLNLDEILTK